MKTFKKSKYSKIYKNAAQLIIFAQPRQHLKDDSKGVNMCAYVCVFVSKSSVISFWSRKCKTDSIIKRTFQNPQYYWSKMNLVFTWGLKQAAKTI